jgi:pyridoxamine 5'-phosphate oxidase
MADAFVLATASASGVPSARMVSLRGIEARALLVYTHEGSRKTRELAENPAFAAVFHWSEARRQLRLEGVVEPMAREAVERYFATRPRAAQISAVVSSQGRASPGLEVLRAACDVLAARDEPIACPEDFIGLRLVPHAIEFWCGSEDRLHDRVAHLWDDGRWRALALQP